MFAYATFLFPADMLTLFGAKLFVAQRHQWIDM
jgi:hypothetical protein